MVEFDPVVDFLNLYRHLLTLPEFARQAAAFGRVIYGGADMEQALGLVNGRGQSWKQQVAHTERDGLIRQAVARHFPGPLSPAAEAFAKALANYAATAWKLDREKPLGACPYRPGTLKSALFHILKLDPNPLRKSRLRDILSS